jgi:hypothetical protein
LLSCGTITPDVDVGEFGRQWAAAWGDCRPIGPELCEPRRTDGPASTTCQNRSAIPSPEGATPRSSAATTRGAQGYSRMWAPGTCAAYCLVVALLSRTQVSSAVPADICNSLPMPPSGRNGSTYHWVALLSGSSSRRISEQNGDYLFAAIGCSGTRERGLPLPITIRFASVGPGGTVAYCSRFSMVTSNDYNFADRHPPAF